MSSPRSSPVPVINEPQKAVFGIDLGTIRTRVAIVQNKDGLPMAEIIENIPSVVSFTKNRKCLVGPCAKDRIIASASNTFRATKCLMASNYEDPVVQLITKKSFGFEIFNDLSSNGRACFVNSNFHQVLTATQIAALILSKVKELVETKLNVPMKNIVLATPAHFTDAQIQATREAAKLAGLNLLKMVDEPTAVVLACYEDETDSKTVVVYDFGGTFKVSVLKIQNGESEVKSTISDVSLGGDDFDDVLMAYFVAELMRETRYDVTNSIITMQWLRKTAEYANIDLCYSTEVNIRFYVVYLFGVIQHINLKLTRAKFEQLVAEFINKTRPLCHKALEEAKISVSDIDEVFAVGGITCMPKVRATVEEIFGKVPHEVCGRMEAVAVGAGLVGHSLSADITDDSIPSVEISPLLPRPAKEDEKFNYQLTDQDTDTLMNDVLESTRETGIIGILTEEEADYRIIQHRTSQNRMDNSDVNFIPAYKSLISHRRKACEMQIPDDMQKDLDFFKKERDDFVEQELRHVFERFRLN